MFIEISLEAIFIVQVFNSTDELEATNAAANAVVKHLANDGLMSIINPEVLPTETTPDLVTDVSTGAIFEVFKGDF